MNNQELTKMVHRSMQKQCFQNGYATAVDVLIDMGILPQKRYEDWRKGKVPYLESVCSINLKKLSTILHEMNAYAKKSSLKPSVCFYKQWGAKRNGHKATIPLRFSKSGNPEIERRYATHYVDSIRCAELKAQKNHCDESADDEAG